MPDETMIFGVSEEGPNGDALGFIDLTKLHVGNKVHDAYRAAVLEAAQQRREKGFGCAYLPHEGMLLLMHEVPSEAKVPDAAMPFTIHGFASLLSDD